MYLLLLIMLLVGGFLVFVLILLVQREIQAQRRFEAYRGYVMAYGSEEEKASLMIDEMEDLMIVMGFLRSKHSIVTRRVTPIPLPGS